MLDCGPYQVRENVPSLIIASYNAEAASDKRVVSPARQAVLKITGYSERNTAARILVGVFAGKDEIRGVVEYDGKTFDFDEASRSSFTDIESAARELGETIYDELE